MNLHYEKPRIELKYGKGTEVSAAARSDQLASRQTTSTLPTADEIYAAFDSFRPAVSIFAAGSVVQGWGHGTSDLDLYVILPEAGVPVEGAFARTANTSDPTIYIVLGQFGAFRADIEVWTQAQIFEVIDRFRGQGEPSADRTEQDMLYRLASGRALVGVDWWSAARDRLVGSGYASWLALRRLGNAVSASETAEHWIATGRGEPAALAAREAYVCSLEAILAAFGDFSVNRKWLYRRLNSVPLEGLEVTHAWHQVCMAGSADDLLGWAERADQESRRIQTLVRERAAA